MMAGWFSWSMWLEVEKRRRDAVHFDAVGMAARSTHALQLVDGSVEAAIGDFGIAADVRDAVAGKVLEMRFIGGRALAP